MRSSDFFSSPAKPPALASLLAATELPMEGASARICCSTDSIDEMDMVGWVGSTHAHC